MRSRSLWLIPAIALFLIIRFFTAAGNSLSTPIPFLVSPELLPLTVQGLASGLQPIPNLVHYVYGLSADFGGKPFLFAQYLALRSAVKQFHGEHDRRAGEGGPLRVIFHHLHLPTGIWWKRFQEEGESGGWLELKKCRDVKEIFGRPVEHFAHKADVIRCVQEENVSETSC